MPRLSQKRFVSLPLGEGKILWVNRFHVWTIRAHPKNDERSDIMIGGSTFYTIELSPAAVIAALGFEAAGGDA